MFDGNLLLDKKWLLETNRHLYIAYLKPYKGKDFDDRLNLILSDNRIFRKFFLEIADLLDAQQLFPELVFKFVEKFVEPENFLFYIKTTEKLNSLKVLAERNGWLTKQQITESFCNALLYEARNKPYLNAKAIVGFLRRNNNLYYKYVDKLEIALEMYHAVTHPKNINQHNRNLCGMVVILSILLMDDPTTCIYAFIQLLEKGSYEGPLPLIASSHSRAHDNNFSDIFLSAIKNASNTFGYSPNLFEKFRAATEPGIICNLLQKYGYKQITEATKILTTNNNELSRYYYILDPNIYDKNHTQFNNIEESFKTLLNKYDSGHHIILYITDGLAKGYTQQTDTNNKSSILGVATHHYVILKQIHYDKSNKKIEMTVWTWGDECHIKIDEDFFFKNYFGFISAEKRNVIPVVNLSNEMPCTPGIA